MIIKISDAKNNVVEVEKILKHHSDKQHIDIILREYIPYQGSMSDYTTTKLRNGSHIRCKKYLRDKFKTASPGMVIPVDNVRDAYYITEQEFVALNHLESPEKTKGIS